MHKTFSLCVGSLLVATATHCMAQTPTESLADRYRVMQSYIGFGAPYHPAPTLSSRSDDPATPLTESAMQALSNGDPPWQPQVAMNSSSNGLTFARTNPHGLPLRYYEAAASNSDLFKLPTHLGEPADVTVAAGGTLATHAMSTASTRDASTSRVASALEPRVN